MCNRWSGVSFVGLLAFAPVAPAADFFVNGSSAAGGNGSRQSPFRTVQAGVDAAVDGDVIRVAAGTYAENIRVAAKAVVLEGGYAADWTRDLSRNTTTLRGLGNDAVINLIGANATIDGFRITGGTGSTQELPYGYHGGGIYSSDGSPVISNNTIEDNDLRRANEAADYFFGGGIHVTNAGSATIMNNTIRRNVAGRGGGVSAFGQAVRIEGNTIESNVGVGDHGGGLYVAAANTVITRNVFRRNEIGRDLGYGWGGGLIVFGASNVAELSYNVLSENFAAAYGAAEFIDEGATANIHHELIFGNLSAAGCEAVSAIAVDGGDGIGSRATISQCTVVGNLCATAIRGNGLQVENLSEVTVTNSIFWNNGGDDFATDGTATLRVTYTNSQERMSGVGNISADPRFVSAGTNDYRLAAGSPCIDAGDPASPVDNADAGDRRADMGVFSGGAAPTPLPAPAPDMVGNDAPDPTPVPPGRDDDAWPHDDGSDGADHDAGYDTPNIDEFDLPIGSSLCPMSAGMLLSLSVVGLTTSRRRVRR